MASQVPSTMRAVLVKDGKGPSTALYIGEAPTPSVDDAADSIVVKTKAFGINRMDLLQREGKYPVPPGASNILGVEFSGTVAARGKNVTGLELDAPVYGLTTGGAYAEYVRVPAAMVLQKPDVMSWEQAASVPEAWLTAFQALRLLAPMKKGDNVLVHAGASGVGIAAIQLARTFGARNVYVTAGSEEKIAFCKSLGASDGINYKKNDWSETLAKLTDGEGVDVILDYIGAPYFQQNIDSLKRDGRLSLQGFMGGTTIEKFNLSLLLLKRLRVEGSTLRSRSLEYQSDLMQSFQREGALRAIVGGLSGSAKEQDEQLDHHLVIHKVFDWHDIIAAQDEMAANKSAYAHLMPLTRQTRGRVRAKLAWWLTCSRGHCLVRFVQCSLPSGMHSARAPTDIVDPAL